MAPGACLPLTSWAANLCKLSSDCVLFWVLQAGLVLFALYAAIRDWIQRIEAPRDNLGKQSKRGDIAVGYFLVVCAALIGLPVAICASVDVPVVQGHRILWILGDTVAVVYVCLRNRWFRNHLLGFVRDLSELE